MRQVPVEPPVPEPTRQVAVGLPDQVSSVVTPIQQPEHVKPLPAPLDGDMPAAPPLHEVRSMSLCIKRVPV